MGDRQALAMDGRQKVGRFTQTLWKKKSAAEAMPFNTAS